jgi:hypothetical protein
MDREIDVSFRRRQMLRRVVLATGLAAAAFESRPGEATQFTIYF